MKTDEVPYLMYLKKAIVRNDVTVEIRVLVGKHQKNSFPKLLQKGKVIGKYKVTAMTGQRAGALLSACAAFDESKQVVSVNMYYR